MRRIASAAALVAGPLVLAPALADSIALHTGTLHPGREQIPCSRNPGLEYSTGRYAFGMAQNSFCEPAAYVSRRWHLTRRISLGAGLISGYAKARWGTPISPMASVSVKHEFAVATYLPGPSGGAVLFSMQIPLDR